MSKNFMEENNKQIADLETKLAEVKNSCDYYMKRSNDLVCEIGEYKKHIRFKGKEITELKQQLHDLPKKIVEEVEKNFTEYLPLKDKTGAGFYGRLNAILKKFGGEDVKD